jgi:hypothetical protein
MDQSTLVKDGQSLVELLDKTPAHPRFAMWVNFSDTDSWKLWIVPAEAMDDKREFYHTVADTLSRNRDDIPGLDIGMVEFTKESKPVVQAMRSFIKIPGIGAANVSGNRFNGVFVPDGILLRSNL